MASKRLVGRFWNYTGNSVNGRNHERKTPVGYDLDTVERVCAIADDCEDGHHYGRFASLVTDDEARRIETIHHKSSDNFGQEITVKAPQSVWAKAKASLL